MAQTQYQASKTTAYLTAGLLAAAGVFLDQITKQMAVMRLKGQEPTVLIDRVFEFCYLENRGAAFGLLQNQQAFFLINTVLILALLVFFYGRLLSDKRFLPLRICSICICAGALGNMIDRIRLGYVVDFLYFSLIDFPIFNVADIYVTVSVFALAALMLWYYKEEDFDQILHGGRKRRGDED